jgi:hypothetical protein
MSKNVHSNAAKFLEPENVGLTAAIFNLLFPVASISTAENVSCCRIHS